MKDCISKSIIRTDIYFVALILYVLTSILVKFSYLDLCYLLVVVVSFIMYLIEVKKLYH